tara:strand:+ start:361 stop:486 length:126 start_codon:yes stop_codon:yes gene_type:complete
VSKLSDKIVFVGGDKEIKSSIKKKIASHCREVLAKKSAKKK